MTPTERDEPTREMPGYAGGRAKASGSPDAGWRDDADQIGKPLDAGDYDGAARTELAPPRRGRGLLWLAGIVAVVAALIIGAKSIDLWPNFSNPFAEEQTDRSQPPLLKSIQDLSRFTAAEGNFEVVIDLQRNRQWVPDFLLNERTLFVAAGSVEAYVDFSTIGEGAIVVSPDGKSVEITLPEPALTEPRLDLERSYVFAEERGILNRAGDLIGGGDPNRQREVYQKANDRMAQAAVESQLRERAKENTTKMLEGLMRSLGYETVTVKYTAP